MEDIYESILRDGYGLKLYSAARSRTCLICSTDKGVFDLKKNIYDESIINLEGEIKKSLNKNGFMEVIPFIDTLEGSIFYAFNDSRYTLEGHKNFAPADEEGKWDYIKGAQTMAKMHLACEMEDFVCDRKNYGRLESIYEKRIAEFKRIRKRIKKDGIYDKADMIIKEYYNYYINRAQAALDMLKKSDYMAVSAEAEKRKTFCHNSFKGENIKLEPESGKYYVDNFGKAAYDICVSDLAYYIRQLIKREDTTAYDIKAVIDAYDGINTLSGESRSIAAAMVVFPWKFMSLCNEYYNKRKVFTFDASVQRIERCAGIIEKEESIINII
jgi:CotS family spore coat protein